jgi:hypothetical protein
LTAGEGGKNRWICKATKVAQFGVQNIEIAGALIDIGCLVGYAGDSALMLVCAWPECEETGQSPMPTYEGPEGRKLDAIARALARRNGRG